MSSSICGTSLEGSLELLGAKLRISTDHPMLAVFRDKMGEMSIDGDVIKLSVAELQLHFTVQSQVHDVQIVKFAAQEAHLAFIYVRADDPGLLPMPSKVFRGNCVYWEKFRMLLNFSTNTFVRLMLVIQILFCAGPGFLVK